ncbi:MAG: hypothetical protein AAFP69_19390, partial [Planctomycetota bacterium]
LVDAASTLLERLPRDDQQTIRHKIRLDIHAGRWSAAAQSILKQPSPKHTLIATKTMSKQFSTKRFGRGTRPGELLCATVPDAGQIRAISQTWQRVAAGAGQGGPLWHAAKTLHARCLILQDRIADAKKIAGYALLVHPPETEMPGVYATSIYQAISRLPD